MLDLREDKPTKKAHKVWAWLSAVTGVIILDVSIAVLLMSKSSISGWALFTLGLAFLGLAFRLVRSLR
jgi:hypothetical protein